MDREGRHTDRYGKMLALKDRVRMHADEPISGEVGTGTVESLPPAGNDWHGFPHVRFDHDGKLRHVADVALVLVTDKSTAPYVDAQLRKLSTTEGYALKIRARGNDADGETHWMNITVNQLARIAGILKSG